MCCWEGFTKVKSFIGLITREGVERKIFTMIHHEYDQQVVSFEGFWLVFDQICCAHFELLDAMFDVQDWFDPDQNQTSFLGKVGALPLRQFTSVRLNWEKSN